jgi:SAM-dependent methyltransferase
MERHDDPAVVQGEYASERGLAARASVYAGAEGPDTRDLTFQIVSRLAPGAILEVGCGQGELAARFACKLRAAIIAVDLSERMVELARGRGVDARIADVQQLPFADDAFDCVIAAWMLYHVPDLDRAFGEIARVLRPGGHLVAITNGTDHLEELWHLVGGRAFFPKFHADNGERLLAPHFAEVSREDVHGAVTFRDRETVERYIGASISAPERVGDLPDVLPLPLVARRHNAVFTATAR